jgi:hypothetical protein
MPAVNDVGEPCAGEPHARIEVAGVGNGAKNLVTATGVAHSSGKPAESKASGPTGRRSHRASSRPYGSIRELSPGTRDPSPTRLEVPGPLDHPMSQAWAIAGGRVTLPG